MLSVSGNIWEEDLIQKKVLEKVKFDNGYSEIISRLIISKKFSRVEINSIDNKINIGNPFLKSKDFDAGFKILEKSLRNNEKIMIFGDYDVDGCISTSLFVNFLKKIKYNNFFYHIPNRFKDGYGASLELIKELEKKKPNLVIFVDCGSNSSETINYLNTKKIKTIILDHHDIFSPYPKANCIINPKKICDYNQYDYLCSSTFTFFFIDFFLKKKKN